MSTSRGHLNGKLVGASLRGWEPKGTWVIPVNNLKSTWAYAYQIHGYLPVSSEVKVMAIGELCNRMVDIANSESPTKDELSLFIQGVTRLANHWNLGEDEKCNWKWTDDEPEEQAAG